MFDLWLRIPNRTSVASLCPSLTSRTPHFSRFCSYLIFFLCFVFLFCLLCFCVSLCSLLLPFWEKKRGGREGGRVVRCLFACLSICLSVFFFCFFSLDVFVTVTWNYLFLFLSFIPVLVMFNLSFFFYLVYLCSSIPLKERVLSVLALLFLFFVNPV